jgi:hypothetical protein
VYGRGNDVLEIDTRNSRRLINIQEKPPLTKAQRNFVPIRCNSLIVDSFESLGIAS